MGSHAGLVSQDFPIQCLRMGTKDTGQGRRRVEVASWTTEICRAQFSDGHFVVCKVVK